MPYFFVKSSTTLASSFFFGSAQVAYLTVVPLYFFASSAKLSGIFVLFFLPPEVAWEDEVLPPLLSVFPEESPEVCPLVPD